MRRRVPAPTLARRLALAAGLILAAGCATTAPTGPSAERPTYKVGERWYRSDGAFELTRIENGRYVFSAGPSREIHLTQNLGVAYIRSDPHYNRMDPPLDFSWPMRVGQFGSGYTSWRWALRPEGISGYLMHWKVQAYEDVTVTAGTYKAFRIELNAEAPGGGWKRALRIWYAPEVRQFVKWDTEAGMFPLSRFGLVAVDQTNRQPMVIAFAEPGDQARLPKRETRLTGRIETEAHLTAVRVTLNGTEVAMLRPPAPQGKIALDVPLTLREGKNVIVVAASDSAGETREAARTLFFEAPRAAAPAPAPVRPSGPTAPGPTSPPGPATPSPPSAPATTPAPEGVQIRVTSPADQARSTRDRVTLTAALSAGRGIAGYTVAINGTEVVKREEPTPPPTATLSAPLSLREGMNVIVVTARDRAGASVQDVRTVHYERVSPLAVTVRYPSEGARVSDEASLLAAVVSSSKGVARVTVTLNGGEIHNEAERVAPRSALVTVPLKLRDGSNAIVVTAREPDGTERRETRTVVFERPAVAAAPPPGTPATGPTARPEPDRWAVVIGVGQYEHPGVAKLQYTVADAQGVYDVLTTVGGYKPDHVLLLTDRTERKPTLRNIRWALGTFLARSARKDDTVLIFFAGHGAPEVDQRGMERDGLSKYLAPIDTDPDDLFSSALAMDDIQTIFGRIEADRVVMFLDSCYSGAAGLGGKGGRTFAPKQTRAMNLDDQFLDRLTRSKGRAIITASRPSEVSIELPELGHGLFTYYLLEGLRGKGDLNRDGIVSLQELYEYLEQQVTQKSRSVGGNQHPVMKGELEGVLPLVRVRGR